MYGAEDCRFKSGDTELGQPVTGKLSVNAALDGYLFQINETVKARISASTN